MAASDKKSNRFLILFALGSLLLGAGIVALWMKRADDARADLLARQKEAMTWDRVALQQYWGGQLSWHPDPNANEALAVTPRSKFNDFDAMYVVYRGFHGIAVLTLTQIGGYFNQERINAHQWPETMIPRRLTDAEKEGLATMIRLMEGRIATLDEQSERRGWNEHVLKTARQLAALNGIDAATTQTLTQVE